MANAAKTQKEAQIATNLRLLLILEEVARLGVAIKPAALGERLGLPKPTIHRLVQTAEAEGFLQRDLDGRSYGPGPRMRLLAVNTMSSEHVRSARLAILRGVAEEIGETCNLACPDREGMIYLDRVETQWPLRIQLPIGTQVPFHCTATGKMYLSTLRVNVLEGILSARPLEQKTEKTLTCVEDLKHELDLTRTRQFSTDDEEFMAGMAAVAVPVNDSEGRLAAALSIHAPVQRMSLRDLVDCLPVLQRASQRLSDAHAR